MTQLILDPVLDADVAAFWAEQPQRPAMPSVVAVPVGAPTLTITCRACGARDNIAIEWSGLLCCGCRSDLEATRQRVVSGRAAAEASETAAHEAWAARQESLDDGLYERWAAALEKRTVAEAKVARLSNARLYGDVTPQVQAARIAEARAELAAITERFARTAANEANPLCALVRAETEYRAALQQARREQARWDLALQEVEAAKGESLPF